MARSQTRKCRDSGMTQPIRHDMPDFWTILSRSGSGLGGTPTSNFSRFGRKAKCEKYASVCTLALLAGTVNALEQPELRKPRHLFRSDMIDR